MIQSAREPAARLLRRAAAPSPPVRRCACGGTVGPGGECDRCRAKRLAGEAGRAPPEVGDALRGPGAPLDASTRAFMEPRFGHSFADVRVHSGTQAARSADAVGARAYAVGRDVVFGAGQYAPGTHEGRRLLAHELTHVVQQGGAAAPRVAADLKVGRATDPAEREATSVAARVAAGEAAGPVGAAPAGLLLRDGRDNPNPAPAPPPPSTDGGSGAVCGPDVTAQVSAAVANTRTTFGGWSSSDKSDACHALNSLSTGAYAWDILELHNNAWILDYRPACATKGASPPCGSTVKVGSDCHYAGSVNYVIFGTMCDLCRSHFTAIKSSDASDFDEASMLKYINWYKGTGFTGLATPSANFGPSKEWAKAGFAGWPGGSTPAGDRNTCAPTCGTAYSGGAFSVNWVPKGAF
jgi:hypothetical protein